MEKTTRPEPVNRYSKQEERLNVWSHFAGFILSVIGVVVLILKGILTGSTLSVVSYAIYGLSMILLYLASTTYHHAVDAEKRKKLKVFDHAAIYVLIAGSYTPFSLLVLKGTWGWSVFGVVWGIAVMGITMKLFYTGRFKLLSTISYVLMGWVIVVAIKPLIANFTFEGLMLLLTGGIFYTTGALLYSIKRIPFNHAIFHFFVLFGSLAHFLAIYLYTS
ncbi:MAG: hemolysin III family protein [Bacteroidales bacterium]|nr:hemolysin III family protein [Bacteroidales bacterium]